MRAVQIIADHNAVKTHINKRPRLVFEIRLDQFDALVSRDIRHTRQIDIDRNDAKALVRQIAGMTAASARQVQDPATGKIKPAWVSTQAEGVFWSSWVIQWSSNCHRLVDLSRISRIIRQVIPLIIPLVIDGPKKKPRRSGVLVFKSSCSMIPEVH